MRLSSPFLSGTAVAAYATTSRPPPSINFSLDGNITTFTGPIGTALGRSTAIFQAEGLAPSQNHTLRIIDLSTTGWYLDYFVYRASPVPLSLTTLTSSSPTTPLAPAAIPVTSSNRTIGPPATSSLSPQIIAAIVGSVIVGLVALASIIFGLVLWKRRGWQWTVEEDVPATSVTTYTIYPFASRAQPPFLSKRATIRKREREGGGDDDAPGGHGGPVLNIPTASSSAVMQGVFEPATVDHTRRAVSHPSREVDGGVRLASGYAHSEVSPPSYARYGQD